MVSHLELDSDPPIESDRESGYDSFRSSNNLKYHAKLIYEKIKK